jgi:hypothetical protein
LALFWLAAPSTEDDGEVCASGVLEPAGWFVFVDAVEFVVLAVAWLVRLADDASTVAVGIGVDPTAVGVLCTTGVGVRVAVGAEGIGVAVIVGTAAAAKVSEIVAGSSAVPAA